MNIYLVLLTYLEIKKLMDIRWFSPPLCFGVLPGFCASCPTTTVTL